MLRRTPQPTPQQVHPLLQSPHLAVASHGGPGSAQSQGSMHTQASGGLTPALSQTHDQSMAGPSQSHFSGPSDVEMATESSIDSAHSPIVSQVRIKWVILAWMGEGVRRFCTLCTYGRHRNELPNCPCSLRVADASELHTLSRYSFGLAVGCPAADTA